MSAYHDGLNLVLGALQARQAAGGADWSASADALVRLRTPRAPSPAAPLPSPAPPAVVAALPGRVASASPVDPSSKAERLARLRACPERIPCAACPYGAGEHGHIVFGVGSPDAEVMFIGEAPGAEEDAQGEPFVGRAGQLLTKIITTMGYQREDVYIANILKCRPDTPGQTAGNRPPTPAETESCRPTLIEQIEIIAPRAIVALGATAMRGLLGSEEPMRDLRGRWHDFRGTPVMATYHPSYLLRNQAPAEKRKVWEDMLLVKGMLGHTLTPRDHGYFLTRGQALP